MGGYKFGGGLLRRKSGGRFPKIVVAFAAAFALNACAPKPVGPMHGGHRPDDLTASSSIAQTDRAMFEIVDQLAEAPVKSLQVSDVETLLGIKLTNTHQTGLGEKFAGEATADGAKVELFVLPAQEFRLMITRLHDQQIGRWRTGLTERGWIADPPILHPFVMDSFRKGEKQIRLEHNSTEVFSITVFGLNT